MPPHAPPDSPAFLNAYPFLQGWIEAQEDFVYRQWILDSGAFSAWNSGEEINLAEYIDACQLLLQSDIAPDEIFALDVVGDWKAGLKNTEAMWEAGIEAIPCYHAGEPWEVLTALARDYPKIAIGGMAYASPQEKLKFAKQCFARVWPKRIHGFAYCFPTAVLSLPFDSVDSTSWFLQPIRYHRFKGLGGSHCKNSPTQSLKGEIDWYLELERKARFKWKSTWDKQEDGRGGPCLYLAFPFDKGAVTTGYER